MVYARKPNGTKSDPGRTFRCSEVMWERAKRRAAVEGTTMSDVARQLVEGYANGALSLPKITKAYRDVS
jgi:hypothetical protein